LGNKKLFLLNWFGGPPFYQRKGLPGWAFFGRIGGNYWGLFGGLGKNLFSLYWVSPNNLREGFPYKKYLCNTKEGGIFGVFNPLFLKMALY